MIKKIMFLNLLLFGVVVAMTALLLTERHTIPPEPRLTLSPEAQEQIAAPETAKAEKTYAHLGKAPIFDTIIPRPTPAPTPVPTPPPDPELDKAIAGWRAIAVLPGGMAMFEDRRSKEEWMMNVGEVRPVKFGRWTMDIKLEATNDNEFSATVVFNGDQGKQSMTLSMFD